MMYHYYFQRILKSMRYANKMILNLVSNITSNDKKRLITFCTVSSVFFCTLFILSPASTRTRHHKISFTFTLILFEISSFVCSLFSVSFTFQRTPQTPLFRTHGTLSLKFCHLIVYMNRSYNSKVQLVSKHETIPFQVSLS